MEHLVDFTITKVYEAKNKEGELVEGSGEHGLWKLYTFYTDKTGKEKFSFMWGEKKPIPSEGLGIKHMEYESEIKGQYTNLKVKQLEVREETKAVAIGNAKEDMGAIPKSPIIQGQVSYWTRYMTDIARSIIESGGNLETADLDGIACRVGKASLIMMGASMNNGQILSQDSEDVSGSTENNDTNKDTTDYSGRIDCPTITNDEGTPKNILKIACKTCEHREGCPAL